MARPKILVTGATGFVGLPLVNLLFCEASGYSVRAAVRHAALTLPRGLECFFCGDIGSHNVWHEALIGVDTVVHLAARVHVMRNSVGDPLAQFRETNVAGTLNLARQAARCGARRFIYVSSIKVNGETTDAGKPFTADDVPAPVDPYGVSKLEAESGLKEIGLDQHMEVVVIRPPLVYGPNVKGNLARLLQLIDYGLPIPYANAGNLRSLVGVSNLVDLIVTCITHPKVAGKTLLVSDGEDVSTAKLVRRLAASMGKRARLLPIPTKLGHAVFTLIGKSDMWQRLSGSLQVDSRTTMGLLGWKPPVTMDEGLACVGRWYASRDK